MHNKELWVEPSLEPGWNRGRNMGWISELPGTGFVSKSIVNSIELNLACIGFVNIWRVGMT